MLDENLKRRQEYIINSNELNKPVKTNIYVEGNRQKVELDKKLEEESIKNNVLVSGTIVRQNILNSSASRMTTVNNVVDTEIYLDDDNYNKELYDKYHFNLNKSKDILNNMDSNKNNDIRFFNRNI